MVLDNLNSPNVRDRERPSYPKPSVEKRCLLVKKKATRHSNVPLGKLVLQLRRLSVDRCELFLALGQPDGNNFPSR